MARSRRNRSRPQSAAKPAAASAGTRARRLAPDRPVAILAGLGMLITGYLSLVAGTDGGAAFCGAGSGCDIVQQSRWSTVLGLPLAAWGFALYTLLLVMAVFMKPRLRRWRWLWLLSLAGFAISVYLTIVGLVELDAVCIWCLASLATLTALFLVLTVRRPGSAPGMPWPQWAARGGALALAAVLVLHLYYGGLFRPAEDPRLRALAIHLNETGAKFYGAFWCPNCQEQHELFGAAHERLPYVECTPDGRHSMVSFTCVSKDIRGYPTWIIDGRRYEGVLTPEELARYSGFDWDKNYSETD